ncbi:MAG: CoA-binding protein [Thermoplasmata archaeon]
MSDGLSTLLNPRSVAVVGASANPSKLGNVILKNLKTGRFRLYPVNPKEESIEGLKCYRSVGEVPDEIDLAVIALPAEATIQPFLECVAKGVNHIIVTASGFRESGEAGAVLESQLVDALRGSRTRMLGPNTMGVLSKRSRLDTFFIPVDRSRRPPSGPVALVSQSGAVLVSSMEKLRAAGLGISAAIGLGNKADLTELDILELLATDPRTKCIAMYLESFSDGRRFFEQASRIAPTKPIVLLKAGRTPAGTRAARSHTGAMAASSDRVVDCALTQAGVVRAYDEEELVDFAKALAHVGSIKGDRICVVASAGGYGVIASDYVESADRGAGLCMAKLSDSTKEELRRVVPEFGSIANPVDLTASVTDQMYESVLVSLQNDPGVDGIMMSLELQPPNVTRELVEVTVRRSRSQGAPVVVSLFAGQRTDALVRHLGKRGVVAYPTIWRAVRALGVLVTRGRFLERHK